MVMFLLLQMKLGERSPRLLVRHQLPGKLGCWVSGTVCAGCPACLSPALPLRHGQGRAHCLVLEVVLFVSASQPIPLSALGAFNSGWFSSLPLGLLPGLEEP